ncbi:MAG: hypothetical protein HYS86_00825 [Candidatus Chisholmbacteria bacterium]|nr:hypothetical protein [Candidatus Chisholmbacteria bacterium]
MDLTDRQIQIIKCIVEEYSETAEPVGSDTLDKKYSLGISPATIRNEMAELTSMGYLAQPHTSAGRIPTPVAIRFYVDQLLKERELSVAEEVAVKERVWDCRQELNRLLTEATRVLSERTGLLSLATTDDERLYHAGYARILSLPEFFDIDVTRQVLSLVEEIRELSALFNRAQGNEPVHILIGDDLGLELYRPISLVFADFKVGNRFGRIAVIGPSRLDYSHTIPMLRYVSNLISEIGQA